METIELIKCLCHFVQAKEKNPKHARFQLIEAGVGKIVVNFLSGFPPESILQNMWMYIYRLITPSNTEQQQAGVEAKPWNYNVTGCRVAQMTFPCKLTLWKKRR